MTNTKLEMKKALIKNIEICNRIGLTPDQIISKAESKFKEIFCVDIDHDEMTRKEYSTQVGLILVQDIA